MGSRLTAWPSAVAVSRSGSADAFRIVVVSRRGIQRLAVSPCAPANTTGPCRTAFTSGSSGVASTVVRIGRVTSTRSPVRQVRSRLSQLPATGRSGSVRPFSRTRAPEAQPGTRTSSSCFAAPDVTVRTVEEESGSRVDCLQVMPRSCQWTSEGMNRLTRSRRSSWV
jgi:hypothetical protein